MRLGKKVSLGSDRVRIIKLVLKLHLDEPPFSRFGFLRFLIMIHPLHLRTIRFCSLLAVGMVLCQCASRPDKEQVVDDGTYWKEDHPKGPAKLVISLDEQHIGLVKGGELVGLSPISSGREGYDTHPGTFKVTEKDVDHRSSWYGAFVDESGFIVVEDVDVRKDKPPVGTKFVGAEMRYFMRFNGPIGLHQGYLPGYPASHGCIRLPAKMAERIFHAIPHGTPVEVQQNAEIVALRPIGVPPVPESSVQEAVPAPLQILASAPPVPEPQAAQPPEKPEIPEVAESRKASDPFRFLGLGKVKTGQKQSPAPGATVYYKPEQASEEKAKPVPAPKEEEQVKPVLAQNDTEKAKPAPAMQKEEKKVPSSKKTWFSQAIKPAAEAAIKKAKPEQVRSTRPIDSGRGNQAVSRKKAPEAPAAVVRPRVLPAMRPITPNVPGLPAAPMTLAPTR